MLFNGPLAMKYYSGREVTHVTKWGNVAKKVVTDKNIHHV